MILLDKLLFPRQIVINFFHNYDNFKMKNRKLSHYVLCTFSCNLLIDTIFKHDMSLKDLRVDIMSCRLERRIILEKERHRTSIR